MEVITAPVRITLRDIISYGLWLLGLLALLAYIAFQARFLIEGPEITLDNMPATVQNVRTITLNGTAKNITKITLNGRPIFTDEHGHFKEALVLENGYTIVTIAAVDRYGRQTRVVQPFIYRPTSLTAP